MEEISSRLTHTLPADLAAAVRAALDDWRQNKKVARLWARDASLWTGADEARWLGWLELTRTTEAECRELTAFAKEIQSEGFTHALVLGMGGSSMCPEVLAETFGRQPGFPALHVLDSTDPAQVRACATRIDMMKTLFIVASKSGSTLEPNIFKDYFFERVKESAGPSKAGMRFIAITDPGSKMQQVAERDGFRKIFFGVPSVGGRYSALSNFGMVPAAVMGLDPEKLIARAREMACQSAAEDSLEQNPAIALGAILGVAALRGRDKVTLVASPRIFDFGAWLEQLLAESTGKDGKALIPVDRERLDEPARFSKDRIFVYLRFAAAPDPLQDGVVAALAEAGHPVVCVSLRDEYDLAAEFFRWEIATAVAGSILGVNPFNQPDVEASKIETRKLTSVYETSGALPAESPLVSENGVQLFTDARNAAELAQLSGDDRSLAGFLRAHLARLAASDYFALLAYIEMNAAHEKSLQQIRHAVRDARRVATCLGFGPRFLHSTGQAYKGGPNTGVFLQITCEDADDVPVPGAKYTFGVVKAAQARGDFAVLAERKRRALRVHLGKDVPAGLAMLLAAVRRALA
ncbi:MAG: bifunctional transaldolase/phosoglucose isomerase [Acidobacteria bacterium]|nr:bifunctional transaldolase/phosoglucose isomerase [Acidobacteriota bacterium]MCL5286891.1 bifunctional transaldolase/phosoglucose isomerase [Acidobacteriota bacterium]